MRIWGWGTVIPEFTEHADSTGYIYKAIMQGIVFYVFEGICVKSYDYCRSKNVSLVAVDAEEGR